MFDNIKNILLYNSGGGLGDSLIVIPIFQWLKIKFNIQKIYYIQNGIDKHFENSLKDYDNGFVHTIDFLPQDFAFATLKRFKNYSHFKFGKQIVKSCDIKKFDLIIDTQTRINNSLIVKSIPHQYFISPSAKFILSNPKKLILNSKNICGRIFYYFEKVLNLQISIPAEINNLPKKYTDEASKLFEINNKYIGFSITGGHPSRKKEFSMETIINVANYFSSKNYVPTFLVEEKYSDRIKNIKQKVKNAYFPEHLANHFLRNPLLTIAIGKKLNSAISIDNGVMHMLGLAGTKTAVFFNKNSEKFAPTNRSKLKIYSSYKNKNKKVEDLNSRDIISFVKDFI